MFDSLGFEEVLLVVGLGLVLFSPAEVAGFVRRVTLWQATVRSWLSGMWKGWME